MTGPAGEGPGPRRRGGLATVLVLAVIVSFGAGLGGAALGVHLWQEPATVVGSATTVTGGTTPTERLARVAAAVQPSVVSITVRGAGGSDEGSGVILRSDGTILTNNHVIEAAVSGGTMTVAFSDGKTAEATLVGRDAATDLAVIKAGGVSGRRPATLGSSADVNVGDTVLAIGSPLGLEGTVTSGIVSALHRPVNVGGSPSATTLSDAIQTDAAINPGNSGGPLVDASGRVIGINSAIATLSGGQAESGSIGVGFAIPIDSAKDVADALMRGETPQHALLGVQVSDVSSGGALVESVTSSGPAANAGLQPGDVITEVDGSTVEDASALTAAVRSHRPGDRVSVTYLRDGETRTATATLGSAS